MTLVFNKVTIKDDYANGSIIALFSQGSVTSKQSLYTSVSCHNTGYLPAIFGGKKHRSLFQFSYKFFVSTCRYIFSNPILLMSKEAPWKLILHICCQNVLYIDLHNTWRVMCLVEESLTINLKEAINLYNIRNLHRLMTVKCSENRIHLSRRRFMEDIKSNLHSSSQYFPFPKR